MFNPIDVMWKHFSVRDDELPQDIEEEVYYAWFQKSWKSPNGHRYGPPLSTICDECGE